MKFERVYGNLERFGFTPRKLASRMFRNESTTGVFCVSCPKSGTHLLERVLCLYPSLYRKPVRTLATYWHDQDRMQSVLRSIKKNQFVISHWPFRDWLFDCLQENNLKILYIKRDPRDVLVSLLFYLNKKHKHPANKNFGDVTQFDERLSVAIAGNEKMRDIGVRLKRFQPYEKIALTVKFEDLIAVDTQEREIQRIFKYLDLKISKNLLKRIQNKMISNASPTYRKGKKGDWVNYFKEEHKELFKKYAGEQLIQMGYESDSNW